MNPQLLHMLGKLGPEQIEAFLKVSLVGRIGCHDDGETYVVPISFGYDGSYLYCHAEEGKKTRMMRNNPRICFQVDEMRDMSNWKCVILQGEYQELHQQQERTHAMQILLNRYLPLQSSITTHLGEHWPFKPENSNDIPGIVFRIRILEKAGRFEEASHSPTMLG